MICFAKYAARGSSVVWLALTLGLGLGRPCAAEESFGVLQIGTQVYSNVTVTTKAKTYVMIMHSAGMTSLKVSELSPEQMEQLGYVPPPPPKTKAETAKDWAKDKLGEANIEKVNAAESIAREQWTERSQQVAKAAYKLDRKLAGAILAVLFLLYLFYCRCTAEICKKVGKPAGILAWLPGFQIFPLLRAADMSMWWFVTFWIPIVGMIVGITWCFKLAKARGKSALTGFLLVLPITSFFAFIYLAFSETPVEEKPERRNELMTLETA